MQPTGWIGAILASRSSKKAILIYQCDTFQPAADGPAASWLRGPHRFHHRGNTPFLRAALIRQRASGNMICSSCSSRVFTIACRVHRAGAGPVRVARVSS